MISLLYNFLDEVMQELRFQWEVIESSYSEGGQCTAEKKHQRQKRKV